MWYIKKIRGKSDTVPKVQQNILNPVEKTMKNDVGI